MMRAGLAGLVIVLGLCTAAQADVFECKRGDAPETVYLKIDAATKGALVADDAKIVRNASAPAADDFTALEVNFQQFLKYSFDRFSLTLTRKSIGVTNTFKCTRMATP